ncbi:glycosyltransferase family 4 protein [Sphingobium bisphenolivorans]|uniref:glycosyltransferase family 4 protein n=1 Tax=Sphingobium bisphenolivorans TaxID=1335760 RepID=UPI00039A8001|nr:glycosyltransferase family 4 protein [Sphingobium bisphenolivorans]
MRILMLAPQPFYEERGTPIAVRLAAEALAAQGHEVDLLSFHLGRSIPMPGVRHHRIAPPPGIRHVPIGFSFKKVVCDLYMLGKAARMMLHQRYDVLHAVEEAAFFALPLAALGRAKLVYDADSILSEQIVEKWPKVAPLAGLVAWVERLAYRRSDLVVAVCPAVRDAASRAAPAARVHLLPDAVMGEGAPPPVEEDLRAEAEGREVALYVGNLEAYQGVPLLLQAMAMLPPGDRPLLVVIGGDEAAVERHRLLAEGLDIAADVQLLGVRPLSALGAYLPMADILCSPRIKGRNTPMKIFSYMASGRAILATDIESHRQVLDAECAMLVTPDAAGMAAGLQRLKHDPACRARLGDAARAKALRDYSHAAFEGRLRRAYAMIAPDGLNPPAAPALKVRL